jgi:hypothetical protein
VINVAVRTAQGGAFGPSDSRQGAAGCREGECSHGADAAFWLAATRAGALEPARSQGLAPPNVAAGPTLPARQTCAPPTVGRALQVAMRGLQPRGRSGLARGDARGGIRKDDAAIAGATAWSR